MYEYKTCNSLGKNWIWTNFSNWIWNTFKFRTDTCQRIFRETVLAVFKKKRTLNPSLFKAPHFNKIMNKMQLIYLTNENCFEVLSNKDRREDIRRIIDFKIIRIWRFRKMKRVHFSLSYSEYVSNKTLVIY